MGSMEARGRLPLSCGSKCCVGRRDGCSLARNDNLHDWGWAPRAGEAEDGGGAAATGELPRAGKGVSKQPALNSTLPDALCNQQPLHSLFAGSVWPSDPSAVLYHFWLSQCQRAERGVLSAGWRRLAFSCHRRWHWPRLLTQLITVIRAACGLCTFAHTMEEISNMHKTLILCISG